MIHRLLLQNWRSFERLDLSFESGTTFVVAPNGVGKSSLVLGLAWAVFGDHSNVDSKSCIRAGLIRRKPGSTWNCQTSAGLSSHESLDAAARLGPLTALTARPLVNSQPELRWKQLWVLTFLSQVGCR